MKEDDAPRNENVAHIRDLCKTERQRDQKSSKKNALLDVECPSQARDEAGPGALVGSAIGSSARAVAAVARRSFFSARRTTGIP